MALSPLDTGELKIAVRNAADGAVRLEWRGKSNERQPGLLLRPFFDQVMAHAEEAEVGISLHFEDLEYFNSSTITAVIRFIQAVRERKLAIRISYDSRVHAQKLSFEALKPLETLDKLVTVIDCATDN